MPCVQMLAMSMVALAVNVHALLVVVVVGARPVLLLVQCCATASVKWHGFVSCAT